MTNIAQTIKPSVTVLLAQLALLAHQHGLSDPASARADTGNGIAKVAVATSAAVDVWCDALGIAEHRRRSYTYGDGRRHDHGWMDGWHGWHVVVECWTDAEHPVQLDEATVAELTALDGSVGVVETAQAASGLAADDGGVVDALDRRCAYPGDHEHGHAMCEDAVLDVQTPSRVGAAA